jgi:hypothetical protein
MEAIQGAGKVGQLFARREGLHRVEPRSQVAIGMAGVRWHTRRIIR